MSTYKKSEGTGGAWVDKKTIKDGTKVSLVSETKSIEGGEYGSQDVAKARFEGDDESKNVQLNRTTLNGLIDAFGEESNDWIGKLLFAHIENAIIGGKRRTILYLVPDGYELTENSDGYLDVLKKGGTPTATDDPIPDDAQEEIKPEDLPF